MKMLIVLLFIFSGLGQVQAEQSIDIICCSHHFNRDKNYQETNLGIIYKYDYPVNKYMLIGRYNNSEYNYSNIIGLGKRWKISEDFTVAIEVGIVDGYNRGVQPFLAPMISYRDFIHLAGVPFDNGVIALRFTALRW